MMGFPELKHGGIWDDKHYFYRRMKGGSGRVERIAKIDKPLKTWVAPMEHVKDDRKCYKFPKTTLKTWLKK
jgi:hypothetical protein